MELISFYQIDGDGNPAWAINDKLKEKFALIYNTQYDCSCPEYERATGGKGRIVADEQEQLLLDEIKGGPFAASLRRVNPEYLANCYLQLAILGLSLKKGFATECYIQSRSIKIGKDETGKDIRSELPTISISGYGEVKMRQRAGQIEGIESPVIVRDCDQFAFGEQDGKKVVSYMKSFNAPQNARIVACYVKILLRNGRYDYYVMDMDGIARLAEYSRKSNSRGKEGGGFANALYTSNGGQIDTGFLIAKTIKHAFKAYPRLEIGNAVMEADDDVTEQPPVSQKVDTAECSGTDNNDNDGLPF